MLSWASPPPPSRTGLYPEGLGARVGDRAPEPLEWSETETREPYTAHRRLNGEERDGRRDVCVRPQLEPKPVGRGEHVEHGSLHQVVGERHPPGPAEHR